MAQAGKTQGTLFSPRAEEVNSAQFFPVFPGYSVRLANKRSSYEYQRLHLHDLVESIQVSWPLSRTFWQALVLKEIELRPK